MFWLTAVVALATTWKLLPVLAKACGVMVQKCGEWWLANSDPFLFCTTITPGSDPIADQAQLTDEVKLKAEVAWL